MFQRLKTTNLGATLKVIISTLSLLLSINAYAAEKTTLTLAFEDKDSFPNYLGNHTHVAWPNPGYSVELLKQLEQRLPIHIKFVRLPWKRCLKSLGNNSVDGVFNASFKEKRMALGVYPFNNGMINTELRITKSSHVFFSKDDNTIQWDGNKLHNFTGQVGVVMGYSTADDLANKGIQVRASIRSPQQNLNLLMQDRVSLIAGSESQYQNIMRLNHSQYAHIKKLSPAISTKPYYLILSHRFYNAQPQLSIAIWHELKKIRESPLGERLRKKYHINS